MWVIKVRHCGRSLYLMDYKDRWTPDIMEAIQFDTYRDASIEAQSNKYIHYMWGSAARLEDEIIRNIIE